MNGKKQYFMSKTLWANLLAMVALFVQKEYGFVIDAEVQLGLLAAINAALRFVTKEPLDWGKIEKEPGFIRLPLLLLMTQFAACLLLVACATSPTRNESPQSVSAKSLLSARQLIISAGITADSLCTTGVLKQRDCDQARDLYEQGQAAYRVAADAFLIALEAGDSSSWKEFEATQPRLMSLATNLDTLVKSFSGSVTGDRGPGTGDELEPVPASNGGAK